MSEQLQITFVSCYLFQSMLTLLKNAEVEGLVVQRHAISPVAGVSVNDALRELLNRPDFS